MLHLHTSPTLEPLARVFAAVAADAPADPMVPEWVAVGTEALGRWLSLELSRHLGAGGPGQGDGIAANLHLAFPGALRSSLLAVDSPDGEPDRWAVPHLVWSLVDLFDHLGRTVDPSARQESPVLIDLERSTSRYGTCRQIADLFDRYHVHHPQMIRQWVAGDDVDPLGRALPTGHRWQPVLWRSLRHQIGVPSPAERLPDLIHRASAQRLALRTGDVEVPDRLSFFGLSQLPGGAAFLELAAAVATSREVHLFVVEPSPGLARELSSVDLPTGLLRADDHTDESAQHPLLRSWGRVHREASLLLADAQRRGEVQFAHDEPVVGPSGSADRLRAADGGPRSMLSLIHDDIQANRAPSRLGDRVDPTDASVQFHACFGDTRQVEALYDVVLHLLNDEQLGLTEDDIVVLCPNLDRFAPLIRAVFGPSADERGDHPDDAPPDRPPLRYRIADRSITTTNPAMSAVSALADLATGQFDAPAVLDFVAREPVRARFGFTDDDLARIVEWAGDTHVAWGLDAEHRTGFGFPGSVTTNTWQAALDRLLLGGAIDSADLTLAIGDVVPFAAAADDVDLAGRLAEVIWQLSELAAAAAGLRPIAEWVDVLGTAVDRLFAVPGGLQWQMQAVHRILGQIVEHATAPASPSDAAHDIGGSPSTTPLSFADLRRVLADELVENPSRSDFFRGGITISSLSPLRKIAHRVVCLLGMDDSAFPGGATNGDDLGGLAPQIGDSDRRTDFRQALLDSVLMARDRLVVVRDGVDVRTNVEIPAPVAIAELQDCVQAMVGDGVPIEIRHPRQAYDPRLFTPPVVESAGPGPTSPTCAPSFDLSALAGARALVRRRRDLAPFLAGPLDPVTPEIIHLEDLRRFLAKPVETFLTGRLDLRLPSEEDIPSGMFSVKLAGLDGWQVGSRLLRARRSGMDPHEWQRIEERSGALPPVGLGVHAATEISATVDAMREAAASRGIDSDEDPTAVHVELTLTSGAVVVGNIATQRIGSGRGPVAMKYSRAKPSNRLGAWLDLVTLTAHDPTQAWRSFGAYRDPDPRSGATTLCCIDVELAAATDSLLLADQLARVALDQLEFIVDLYLRGLREPLPLFDKTSRALADEEPIHKIWDDKQSFPERADPAISLVFGAVDSRALQTIPAQPHDPPGPATGRAKRLAQHLWSTHDRSVAEVDVEHQSEKRA